MSQPKTQQDIIDFTLNQDRNKVVLTIATAHRDQLSSEAQRAAIAMAGITLNNMYGLHDRPLGNLEIDVQTDMYYRDSSGGRIVARLIENASQIARRRRNA